MLVFEIDSAPEGDEEGPSHIAVTPPSPSLSAPAAAAVAPATPESDSGGHQQRQEHLLTHEEAAKLKQDRFRSVHTQSFKKIAYFVKRIVYLMRLRGGKGYRPILELRVDELNSSLL